MFKKSGNPIVEELTKSCTRRSMDLCRLTPIKIEQPDGQKPIRKCCWCAEGVLRHHNQKYCSDDCSESAMAWAYPQKEQGLAALLVRQNYKCNICGLDWMPFLQAIIDYEFRRYPSSPKIDPTKGLIWFMVKRLKESIPMEQRAEVDHILAINKGGTSLGLDNHQAICYKCHKAKTKVDNSGPRKRLDPNRKT